VAGVESECAAEVMTLSWPFTGISDALVGIGAFTI
jgi:hypothetical protein